MKAKPRLIQVEGQFDKGYLPVVTHPCDIPARLKQINPNFFVMFNARSQTYEVHVTGQPGSTYGCTIPYGDLDARALDYVRRYAAHRFEATVHEMDARNERLERQREKAVLDAAGQKMKEGIRYLDRHESEEELPKELIDA